ncbi:MAG: hypothetical protein IPJ03_17570 [Ignavibacteriales bacterium]|nr:hypothetical protein [Ignavibacteriales bacterium]
MKIIFILLLSCLTFAQEVRFQKDGDTTNIYNAGLTTPAELVAGRKSLDSLFLNQARFKDQCYYGFYFEIEKIQRPQHWNSDRLL